MLNKTHTIPILSAKKKKLKQKESVSILQYKDGKVGNIFIWLKHWYTYIGVFSYFFYFILFFAVVVFV